MAENGTGYPPAAEKRSWADEEETALPPPSTTTSGGSSGVEGETSELKKIEDVTISAEKEINQLGESVGSEIKAFLEVTCMSSGKVRRFAAGTEAGFALHLINCKLGIGLPAALYIEAFKEGEEPVSFGPNAILVNYGKYWKLQTVTKEGYEEATQMQLTSKSFPKNMNVLLQKPSDLRSMKKTDSDTRSAIDFQYFGKILVAFAFIFLLGDPPPKLLEEAELTFSGSDQPTTSTFTTNRCFFGITTSWSYLPFFPTDRLHTLILRSIDPEKTIQSSTMVFVMSSCTGTNSMQWRSEVHRVLRVLYQEIIVEEVAFGDGGDGISVLDPKKLLMAADSDVVEGEGEVAEAIGNNWKGGDKVVVARVLPVLGVDAAGVVQAWPSKDLVVFFSHSIGLKFESMEIYLSFESMEIYLD